MPKMYPLASIMDRNRRGIKTGKFRCPKKGEYFLSGAIPTAYKAPNDLSTEYHIARVVNVRKVEYYEIIE